MSNAERPTRVNLQQDLVIRVLACDKDPLLTDAHLSAKTIDVSESGMKVWLYVPVPQQTRVSLNVPGSGDLRLEGEVRWVEDAGEIRIGVLIDEQSADFAAWREMIGRSVS